MTKFLLSKNSISYCKGNTCLEIKTNTSQLVAIGTIAFLVFAGIAALNK